MSFSRDELRAAYEEACRREIEALKPGNVHVFADGHRMSADQFLTSAEVSSGPLTDPGLPAELLPAGWAGAEAARFFDERAGLLMPAASRFVDACLTDPAGTSGRNENTTTRTGAA